MLKKRIILSLCTFVFLFSLFACQKNEEKKAPVDPYEFQLKEEEKTQVILKIGKTNSTQLIQKEEGKEETLYTIYLFSQGKLVTINKYHFFVTEESYFGFQTNYQQILDGVYVQIKQSILLIETTFPAREERTYSSVLELIPETQLVK